MRYIVGREGGRRGVIGKGSSQEGVRYIVGREGGRRGVIGKGSSQEGESFGNKMLFSTNLISFLSDHLTPDPVDLCQSPKEAQKVGVLLPLRPRQLEDGCCMQRKP